MGTEHTLSIAAYRIGNQIDRLLSKELAELGISYTQALLLCGLDREASRSAPQTKLREYLRITPATMSTLVKRMVKNGYLTKQPAAEDQRIHIISLTARAEALIPAISACLDRAEDMLCKEFSQDEKEYVTALSDKMQMVLME